MFEESTTPTKPTFGQKLIADSVVNPWNRFSSDWHQTTKDLTDPNTGWGTVIGDIARMQNTNYMKNPSQASGNPFVSPLQTDQSKEPVNPAAAHWGSHSLNQQSAPQQPMPQLLAPPSGPARTDFSFGSQAPALDMSAIGASGQQGGGMSGEQAKGILALLAA